MIFRIYQTTLNAGTRDKNHGMYNDKYSGGVHKWAHWFAELSLVRQPISTSAARSLRRLPLIAWNSDRSDWASLPLSHLTSCMSTYPCLSHISLPLCWSLFSPPLLPSSSSSTAGGALQCHTLPRQARWAENSIAPSTFLFPRSLPRDTDRRSVALNLWEASEPSKDQINIRESREQLSPGEI